MQTFKILLGLVILSISLIGFTNGHEVDGVIWTIFSITILINSHTKNVENTREDKNIKNLYRL